MVHDIMVALNQSVENVNALKARRMVLEGAPYLIIRDLVSRAVDLGGGSEEVERSDILNNCE
jgi:hypothetical protein